MCPYRPAIKPVRVVPPGKADSGTRKPVRSARAAFASAGSAGAPVECLRVTRVARLLDVSRKWVYQLIAEGELEIVRLGPRQTRVLKGSLEAYIAGLREEEARLIR